MIANRGTSPPPQDTPRVEDIEQNEERNGNGEAAAKVVREVPLRIEVLNAAALKFCVDCGGVFFVGHPAVKAVSVTGPDGTETPAGVICKYCLAGRPALKRQVEPLIAAPRPGNLKQFFRNPFKR